MPNEVEQLKQRVEMLENIINSFVLNGAYTFQKDIRMLDGKNLMFGTSTGTKIGGSNDKLAFYGNAPVARPSAISAPAGGATVDSEARTTIGTIITTLQTLGLTA